MTHRLFAILASALLMVSCNEMSPTSPATGVGGDWVGEYVVMDCASQGGDFRHCSTQRNLGPYTMRLHLQQSGRAIAGTAELSSAYATAVVPVSGHIDHFGRFSLAGEIEVHPTGGVQVTDYIRASEWGTQLAPPGDTVTGRFRQHTAGYYGFSSVRFVSVLDCQIVSLRRQ